MNAMKNRVTQASLLLRIGLASVFVYAATAATLAPNDWIGFVPPFMQSILPATVFLLLFSIYQAALAVWLLLGKKVRYAAILSAVTVTGIMVVNLGALPATFRDIAIIFAAAALAVLS